MKMKRFHGILAVTCMCLTALSADEKKPEGADDFDDLDWPQIYETSSGIEIALHQPQIDAWTDYRHMVIRAAVAVKPKGAADDQITYGALTLEADTTVDKEKRIVFLGNRTVKSLVFPNAPNETTGKGYEMEVKSLMNPTRPLTMNLDRVLANAERAEQQNKVVGIGVKAPPIFFSSDPAILVIFIGPAKFQQIDGSSLFFGANTNWDVIMDPATSNYYLLDGGTWLTTTDVMKGPWTVTTKLPDAIGKLPNTDDWKDVLAALPAKAGPSPKVFVSDRPAELILTKGKPEIESIPGTKILYLANSESDVFMLAGNYYLLSAGRWFKAKKTEGPWLSAMDNIPTEFAKIPADHAKEHVLASVPGTPDAEEAIIAAQVPQTAKVNRKDAKLEVKYEGDPKFVAIKDTTVKYAANTPNNVFEVGTQYYACEKGVWFEASAPTGPWVVCSKVPAAIYTIPASSPQHNVTYVYVYDSDPETVTVGHTAGYSGSYVLGDLLVFGAGLWLASEILDDWDDHWHYCNWHYHASHWSYGCGARYDWHQGGYYRQGYRAYGPYGGAGYGAVYNPWNGGYARGAKVYGPRGAGFAREAYNPWTNTYGARVGASTPYGSWGKSVVRRDDEWVRSGYRSGSRGTVGGIQTSKGGGALKIDRRFGSDTTIGKTRNDDLYVGKDGKVYKREQGGGWNKLDKGGWKGVDRPNTPAKIKPKPGATRPAVRPSQLPTNRPSIQPKPTPRPSIKPKPAPRPSIQPRPTPRTVKRTTSSQLQRDSVARQRGSTRTTRSRQTTRSRSSGSGGGRSRRR